MEKKKSVISQLFEYAGNHKYFTVSSWILAAISAIVALVPFYYIYGALSKRLWKFAMISERRHILFLTDGALSG